MHNTLCAILLVLYCTIQGITKEKACIYSKQTNFSQYFYLKLDRFMEAAPMVIEG